MRSYMQKRLNGHRKIIIMTTTPTKVLIIFFILLSLLSLSWANHPQEMKTFIREDMPPPAGADSFSRNVKEARTRMPLDHFDPQNDEQFSMRFMFNEEFFGGEGYPIFILVGGEWDIHPGWLAAGNMYEMARENKGYQIYTEHRYYGQSKPFNEFTAENLRFLNMDQALADLAYFITDMKKQPLFAKSKVIMYGGSYAANMVMWFKQRYPHLAHGTIASSGPILAKIDFPEYLEVVHEAYLLEGGEECIATIRQGIEETIDLMNTEEGRIAIEEAFGICDEMNYDDPYVLGYFSGLITWSFSGTVQRASPGSLLQICSNFSSNFYGNTPMEKIGGFVSVVQNRTGDQCWGMEYENFLASYNRTDNNRAWYYQTCTEYGFFQIAPKSGTVFDRLKWLNLDFYITACKRNFDERFDKEFAYAAADRVNLVFGGLDPEVKNTINIHGYIDPWRALGVYEHHISETSPTYTIERASHCFDMQGWLPTDTIRMTFMKQEARRIVASWLNSTQLMPSVPEISKI